VEESNAFRSRWRRPYSRQTGLRGEFDVGHGGSRFCEWPSLLQGRQGTIPARTISAPKWASDGAGWLRDSNCALDDDEKKAKRSRRGHGTDALRTFRENDKSGGWSVAFVRR